MSWIAQIRFRLFWILAAALAWGSLDGSAQATIVMEMGLEEMASEAQGVVLGEVVGVKSAWHERGTGRVIVTEVTLSVERSVKGDLEGSVTFWVLGGRVGDMVQRVSGEPSFQAGERVLVFLERRVEGEPLWVMGMAQGAFRVVEVEGGGEVAVQDTSGLALAEVKTRWDPASGRLRSEATVKEGLTIPQVKALPDLLDEVERLAKGTQSPQNP